jgi:hypothetical protein
MPVGRPTKKVMEPIPLVTDVGAKEVVMYDEQNELSLINLAPEGIKHHIAAVRDNPEYFKITEWSDIKLRNTIKPDAKLCRIRIAFWEELTRAIDAEVHMNVTRICMGITHRQHFYNIAADPRLMAYVLNPPVRYKTAVQESLSLAIDRTREILELPLLDEKGKPQTAVIGAILKALEYSDKRVHGSIMQKVAVHQHHTTGDADSGFGVSDETDLAQLEDKINSVRRQLEGKADEVKKIIMSKPDSKEIEIIDADPSED